MTGRAASVTGRAVTHAGPARLCAHRQAAREAAERIARDEAELQRVQKQAAKLERSLGRSRKAHDEAAARLSEARAELRQYLGTTEGGGGGCVDT